VVCRVAAWCAALQRGVPRCSVVCRVAAWCAALQRGALCANVPRRSAQPTVSWRSAAGCVVLCCLPQCSRCGTQLGWLYQARKPLGTPPSFHLLWWSRLNETHCKAPLPGSVGVLLRHCRRRAPSACSVGVPPVVQSYPRGSSVMRAALTSVSIRGRQDRLTHRLPAQRFPAVRRLPTLATVSDRRAPSGYDCS
jgi:hypothetical protein